MEEFVGQLWHRWITRTAELEFSEQAVYLDEVKKSLAVQFRAFGGDTALSLLPATPVLWRVRRHWLSRLALRDYRVELAWLDGEALHLPSRLAVFPEKELNRQLYFWLVALAAVSRPGVVGWVRPNQAAIRCALESFPGLRGVYAKLSGLYVWQRQSVTSLTGALLAEEMCVQRALLYPECDAKEVTAPLQLLPVPLWLHPCPPSQVLSLQESVPQVLSDDCAESECSKELGESHRRRGERVNDTDGREGLLAFRLESLFSWSEYIKVDRTADDDDEAHARQVADDLDVLALARTQSAPATRLKFDLDLPADAYDDIRLGEGILLPEWDFRKQALVADACSLQLMAFRETPDWVLPVHLRQQARMVRAQFERLLAERQWEYGCVDGPELDLQRYVMYRADLCSRGLPASHGFYAQLQRRRRNLSCLLLADLSLSTDAWVNGEARVIDVIRDSLFLFTEALSVTRDIFSICGFSSRRRDHVRFYPIKAFAEPVSAAVYGRIGAVRPGYYTRMGAAIRYAGEQLACYPSEQRLLLLLTDGKPNDLDMYEGRYGIEDTRHAVNEVRKLGVRVFAVTVDDEAHDYLPYIFGSHQYVLLQRAVDLPLMLPRLYSMLTF